MSQGQSIILQQLNVVSFDVATISGTISRESSEDNTIFTAGSVRYIDPKELRVFTSSRQAANRACRSRGVRFLSGWAVPDSSLDQLISELNAIAITVADAKQSLLANWDDNLRQWKTEHPEVLPYSGRFPTINYVSRNTGASLAVYRIQPTAVQSSAEDGISAEIGGLAGRVLHEISQDVQDTWKPGATQASQRIKNLMGRVADKCRTLEFLGGNLGALATFIDEAMRRLPSEGPIQGADFAVLSGILMVLSSPEKMANTANMVGDFGLTAVDTMFSAPLAAVESVSGETTENEVKQDLNSNAGSGSNEPVASAKNQAEAFGW